MKFDLLFAKLIVGSVRIITTSLLVVFFAIMFIWCSPLMLYEWAAEKVR